MSAPHTGATASGSWPTPDTNPEAPNSSTNRGLNHGGERRRLTVQGLGNAAKARPTPDTGGGGPNRSDSPGAAIRPRIAQLAASWPTPRTNAMKGADDRERDGGPTLQTSARQWATPRSEDSESCGNHPGAKGGDSLTGQIRDWPTPAARDYRTPNLLPYAERGGGKKGEQLRNAVAHWPTPNAEGGTGYMSGSNRDTWRPTLEGMAQGARPVLHHGRPDPTIETPGPGCSNDGPGSRQPSLWPTPAARDGDPRRAPTSPESEAWARKAARGATNAAGLLSDDLSSSAASWSTPRAHCNVTGAKASLPFSEGGYSSKPSLEDQARGQAWATPHAHDGMSGGRSPEAVRPSKRTTPGGQAGHTNLVEQVKRADAPALRLNPDFVDWLMGWPPGWTACVPLATEWSRWWLRSRCSILQSVRG